MIITRAAKSLCAVLHELGRTGCEFVGPPWSSCIHGTLVNAATFLYLFFFVLKVYTYSAITTMKILVCSLFGIVVYENHRDETRC